MKGKVDWTDEDHRELVDLILHKMATIFVPAMGLWLPPDNFHLIMVKKQLTLLGYEVLSDKEE